MLPTPRWCPRATDEHGNLGISPILRINVSNSVAQGPRLIRVPDEFARIQDAINAATDFDTIRVRSGTYYETLNTFGKGIWLESEHGPMQTVIDANFSSRVVAVGPSHEKATIRGFWMINGNALVSTSDAILDYFNNIVYSDSGSTNFVASYFGGDIHNNLFSGSNAIVHIGYHWGTFFNNIIQNATEYGMWNAATFRNPLDYGYNVLWNNVQNYAFFEVGVRDINSDPLLDLTQGSLGNNSPALNAGHPQILDIDGTRSDIGPFGGPYAYQRPEGQNQRTGAYHGKLGQCRR
ncbi:MAG: hypothetical protein IPG71_08485 [bacterium]|nr:hypothetical protein [bacterium]